MRALSPRAKILNVIASGGPSPSTATIPPRGIDWVATRIMFNRSLTRFFGSRALGRFQASLTFSSSMKPRATFSASPRSAWAPAEPAAPNAIRQNCNRADAVLALFLMRSRAKLLVSSSLDSSNTSNPLTIAPDGLIRSWQTREHNNAARSRASSVTGTDMQFCSSRGDTLGRLSTLLPRRAASDTLRRARRQDDRNDGHWGPRG